MFNEQLVQGNASLHALHEDNNLVEVQAVEEGEKLAVLLLVQQVDVVLLESVQCQLGIIVHIHFHGLSA